MQDSHRPENEPPAVKVLGDADLNELRRAHSAISVALALLDELLELFPERPDETELRDVEDVLEEIRDLATAGIRIVSRSADVSRPADT